MQKLLQSQHMQQFLDQRIKGVPKDDLFDSLVVSVGLFSQSTLLCVTLLVLYASCLILLFLKKNK